MCFGCGKTKYYVLYSIQYLRHPAIPKIEYYIRHNTLFYRSQNTITNLILPVRFLVQSANSKKTDEAVWVNVSANWQHVKLKSDYYLKPDKNCYVQFINKKKKL